MKQDLLKYMSERYPEEIMGLKYEGPVITISREYGCPAKNVAIELVKRLNNSPHKIKKFPWRWISKEILAEAAKELDLDPENLKYIFDYKKRGLIDEIILSHSKKYYKSDRKIRNTIARVIRNISIEGNAVIIGRGGVAITRDIEKSLHINLEAPMEWKALRVSEKHGMPIDEAVKLANDIDKKRKEFREYFEGKNSDYTRFDIKYNCMTLSTNEIVDDIINMVQVRKLL
ncbi:cytidylate kinase-like family protein [Bacteroidales bacterium]|nr:cytidylate kinase-like family protein [Bacteroidales bacterium]